MQFCSNKIVKLFKEFCQASRLSRWSMPWTAADVPFVLGTVRATIKAAPNGKHREREQNDQRGKFQKAFHSLELSFDARLLKGATGSARTSALVACDSAENGRIGPNLDLGAANSGFGCFSSSYREEDKSCLTITHTTHPTKMHGSRIWIMVDRARAGFGWQLRSSPLSLSSLSAPVGRQLKQLARQLHLRRPSQQQPSRNNNNPRSVPFGGVFPGVALFALRTDAIPTRYRRNTDVPFGPLTEAPC